MIEERGELEYLLKLCHDVGPAGQELLGRRLAEWTIALEP